MISKNEIRDGTKMTALLIKILYFILNLARRLMLLAILNKIAEFILLTPGKLNISKY